MKVYLTATDIQELMAEFQQQTQADHQCSGDESTLRLPKLFGQSQIRILPLRSGLNLVVSDYFLDEDLILEAASDLPDRAPILLKFFLSGQVAGSVQGSRHGFDASAGDCGLVYCPDQMGRVEFAMKRQIRTVELSINPEVFKPMLDDDPALLEYHQFLEGDRYRPHFEFGKTTPLMSAALHQILNCPYQGKTRHLYLEGKGLELIALYLDQLKHKSLGPQPTRPLNSEDVSRIHQAKDILIRRMDDPPSLLALAQQVGMNDCKLKRGFRQVFGTTAFGYLYQQRMEKAQDLLRFGTLNITEVAAAVGYTNPSAFGAAFKRMFGYPPSTDR